MEHVLEDVHPVLSEVVVFSAFNESNEANSDSAGSDPVAVEDSRVPYAQGVPCLLTIIIPSPALIVAVCTGCEPSKTGIQIYHAVSTMTVV